jgi:acyl carrier protein
VFSCALEVQDIGVDDSFFSLGANSLSMVRVAATLAEMFPGRIGLVDLFRHTTIRTLSDFLSESGPRSPSGATRGGSRGRRRREARMAGQKGS